MIFVRHGVTAAGKDVCYGRLDVSLAPEAEAQMAACLSALPPLSAVVSSPLSRCRIFAERAVALQGVPLRLEPRLQEYDFGAWEGKRWADIPRSESDPWTNDILNAAPPGGERFTDLIARVRDALQQIPEGALIVCHAGPIRAAQMILTGASFDEVFAQPVPFCQPIRLARQAA